MARQQETACLVMADLHYGKETGTFGPAVFRKRMDTLLERLSRIRSLLSDYELDTLRIFILGDANDGTGIYATQEHHQAETNVEQQANDLAMFLADWLRRAKEVWPAVEVDAVPGNHGRAGKFAHEAANWDMVCYRYLKLMLGDDVPVRCDNENGDPFLRKLKIRGHNYLIYHGHDIRTYSNIPWYGMMLRLSRWATSHLAPIDVFTMGHFHSYGDWQINQSRILCTGTMVSDDEWALRTFGWESATRWHFFGISDKRPITWSFGLSLTDRLDWG